jgi:tetratricopeptide (TPR) repeat protein
MDSNIGAAEKRKALESVLNSPELAAAPRARDFLRYVVEEDIAGRADLLKGYTIATEALGRREAFDPDLQSAVRVQAKRLRELLAAYYSGSGRADSLVIEIPRGAYIPVFRRRAADAGSAPGADAEPAETPAEPAPADAPAPGAADAAPAAQAPAIDRTFRAAAILAALVLAAVLAAIGVDRWRSPGPNDDSDRYLAVMAAPVTDPELRPVAEAFVAAVRSRLADFEDIVVVDKPSAPPSRSYTLKIALYPAAGKSLSYEASLTNPNGKALYGEQNALSDACSALFDCAGRLAAKIAAPYGLIYADALETARSDARDCVMESFEYFRHQTYGDLSAVEACLRTAIARKPFNIAAMTALSRVYLQQYRLGLKPSGGGDPLAAAEALAERALELGPQKARAFKSIFEVRFFQRRYEEAFAAARRALEINPYAADILYRVGAAHIARGEFAKGAALLAHARDLNPAAPHWVAFFEFLEAFGRGDEAAAARAADGEGADTAPLGLLARAIVAQWRKDSDAKQRHLRALAKAFPTVAADIPAALERWRLTAPLRQKLMAALNPPGGADALGQ